MSASINHHTRRESAELIRREVAAVWTEYQKTGLHVTAEEADTWLDELETGKVTEPPRPHT